MTTKSRPEESLLSRHMEDYHADTMGYDEFWDAQTGQPRPHWQNLVQQLEKLPESDFRARQQLIHRQLQEIGVTYSFGKEDKSRRAWELDAIPYVLDQHSWQQLNAGMQQRARVLNAVFKDLYGRRELLTSGIIPAEVVLNSDQYIRPAHGLYNHIETPLMFYSADITRNPEGQLVVIRDKTQMPTGVGYCLENRVAMSRVMSSEFSSAEIARLSGFFKAWHGTFTAMVPHNRTPNIVMLSAGASDETYFEHAYLAAYLGYNLVLGADLTVREGKVWLKTLDGLEQVDVILRWVDDQACDSLELKEDAICGVPGLLHAVRQGNVIVINPIGAGILESPGLMSYLPAVCEHLFGEPLLLPQIDTLWCGDKNRRHFVLDNLQNMVIKRADYHAKNQYPASMDEVKLEQLRQDIERQPAKYVGQQFLEFSRAPAWNNAKFQAKPIKIRSFALTEQGSYRVLPGALTRLVYYQQQENPFTGLLKDTWVLGESEENYSSLWQLVGEQAAYRGHEQITSRTAESLFWVGRNIERSESQVRLVRAILSRLTEYSPDREEDALAHIEKLITGLLPHHPQIADALEDMTEKGRSSYWWMMRQFVFGTDLNGGLTATFGFFLNSAFNVRDYWSGDTWRIIDEINQAARRIKYSKPTRSVSDMQELLNELLDSVSAFLGHAAESLSRDGGWLMLEAGRRLERAHQIMNLSEILLSQEVDNEMESLVLDSLLYSQESLATHRRRYRVEQRMETVVELLLLNADYPRSLCYQLKRLKQLVAEMPNEQNDSRLERHEKMILSALTRIQLCELNELVLANKKGERTNLQHLLDDVSTDLSDLAEAISQIYFSHTEGAAQLLQGQVLS